ncbi:MAG: serine/threonine-protein kinase [Pirellulaceae bacterium]
MNASRAIAGLASLPAGVLRAAAPREAVPAAEGLPVVGRWQPTRWIAAGRWTRVVRARPIDAAWDDRGDFALKIAATGANAPLARAQLQREASVCREVQHASLTTVLADHSAGDPAYLVLPYLEGITLREVARRPQVSVSLACQIARQVAEALAQLHEAAWLHGDVKPDNVLLAAAGHATLLDLGMARRLDGEECRTDRWLATTIGYAAPESFSPQATLTTAADTYSLGVVLFELLAGRPLFESSDPTELVRRHRRLAPPQLHAIRPQATPNLSRLIGRMLAKEPLRRPCASEIVRELVEIEIEQFGLL